MSKRQIITYINLEYPQIPDYRSLTFTPDTIFFPVINVRLVGELLRLDKQDEVLVIFKQFDLQLEDFNNMVLFPIQSNSKGLMVSYSYYDYVCTLLIAELVSRLFITSMGETLLPRVLATMPDTSKTHTWQSYRRDLLNFNAELIRSQRDAEANNPDISAFFKKVDECLNPGVMTSFFDV